MKKLILTILISMVTLFPQGKKNVSVLTFVAKGVSEIESEAISDLFSVGLVRSGVYNVLDRANVKTIMDEQSFQNSGCTDSACAVEIGKMLNMDYMFTGSVLKLGAKLFITVSIINIGSGQVEQSEKSPGFLMDDVEDEIDNIVGLFNVAKGQAVATTRTTTQKNKTTKTAKTKKKKSSSGKRNVLLFPSVSMMGIGAVTTVISLIHNIKAEKAYDDYSVGTDRSSVSWESDFLKVENAGKMTTGTLFTGLGLFAGGATILVIDLAKGNASQPKSPLNLLSSILISTGVSTGVMSLMYHLNASHAKQVYDSIDSSIAGQTAVTETITDWDELFDNVESAQKSRNMMMITSAGSLALGITFGILAKVKGGGSALLDDNKVNFDLAVSPRSSSLSLSVKF